MLDTGYISKPYITSITAHSWARCYNSCHPEHRVEIFSHQGKWYFVAGPKQCSQEEILTAGLEQVTMDSGEGA